MRKHAFVALIILMMSVLAGCGGGDGTASTLIASTDQTLVTLDISNSIVDKTLYSASTASNAPVAYSFNANFTASWGDPVVSGTWAFNAGSITLTATGSTTPSITLKRSQTETDYWLVYDTSNNKLFRLYFVQGTAQAYLTSIFKTATTYFLAGTIQGGAGLGMADIVDSAAADVNTVSTLAGSKENTAGDLVNTADISIPTKPSVLFNNPTGVTTDGNGNLYVADTANHVIRKIVISSGLTTTFAGKGTVGSADDATGTLATFSSPQGITCDGSFLYVADTGNAVIRRIALSGTNAVNIFAGTLSTFGAIDNTTSGASAQFYAPVGITNDGTNLYVTDASYHTIRKVKIATITVAGKTFSQSVTTLAGSPNIAGSTDAIGTAARFNTPLRITTNGTNVYVTDFGNHTIRKVVIATGDTSTIAGSAGTKPEKIDTDLVNNIAAKFYYPSGITTDGINLYISEFNETVQSNPVYENVIRKMVLSSGKVSTIAGGKSTSLNSVDTAVTPNQVNARFSRPLDIVSNGTSLFVSNYSNAYTQFGVTYPSFNNIRQIDKIGP